MNLGLLHNLLIKQNKRIKHSEVSSMQYVCPHCGTLLFSAKFQNEKMTYKCEKELKFVDADTLNCDCKKELYAIFNAELGIEYCEKCKNYIFGIYIQSVNKKLSCSENDYLPIYNPDMLVIKSTNMQYYKLSIDGVQIGHMIKYDNAKINSEALNSKISEKDVRDVKIISLFYVANNLASCDESKSNITLFAEIAIKAYKQLKA